MGNYHNTVSTREIVRANIGGFFAKKKKKKKKEIGVKYRRKENQNETHRYWPRNEISFFFEKEKKNHPRTYFF